MIALAVAAALPVAAQADVTLSGSIEASTTLGSNLAVAVDTAFTAASSEVLANGMTATASLNVLAAADTAGTVGLAGDFGTLSAGTAEGTDLTDTDVNKSITMTGVSYAGSFAGLAVNAASGKYNGKGAAGNDKTDFSTYGASYDFNGLTVSGTSENHAGTASTNMTASYAFGDLTIKASKDSGADAVITGTYSATMADLAVTVAATSADTWDLDATYTLGAIALTVEDAENEPTQISGTYSADALSVTVTDTSKVTVGYDMGNADLELVRTAGTAASTTVSYTVAF